MKIHKIRERPKNLLKDRYSKNIEKFVQNLKISKKPKNFKKNRKILTKLKNFKKTREKPKKFLKIRKFVFSAVISDLKK